MIYHIYWGTSGNSGLYLDVDYQILKKGGYNQKIYVNYCYLLAMERKSSLKEEMLQLSRYKGITRKLFQLQEILCGLCEDFVCVQKDKPNCHKLFTCWAELLLYCVFFAPPDRKCLVPN